jgi:hypothetical protein
MLPLDSHLPDWLPLFGTVVSYGFGTADASYIGGVRECHNCFLGHTHHDRYQVTVRLPDGGKYVGPWHPMPETTQPPKRKRG